MRETVIVEAVRTPVGKRNGGLSGVHAADLSAVVLGALVERDRAGPVDRRRRGVGLRVPGRRPVQQHRPVLGARGGLAGIHSGHDGQPGVRVEPAGAGLRRAGGDVRPAGRGGRRRCRGDEPGSARLGTGHRHALRPESACAVRRLLVQPGHLGGDDRREVGLVAHPARRVLGALARTRGGGSGPRRVRRPDRRGAHRWRRRHRRRGHPAGDHRREARRAQARLHRGRRDPRRQLLADLRRRGGPAGHHCRNMLRPRAGRRSPATSRARSPVRTRC